ncbi:MAG: AbrB family transcriptional regulator [Candidatus Bathyarchaeota archaeon]|nr:AbrB family transcriptional regulator [Candidatus Bathyarchaeota archaeon]
MKNNKTEGITTTLSLAKTKSVSLRTTVPISIIKQFDLEAGDKLSWKLKVEKGELVILVRPVKNSG